MNNLKKLLLPFLLVTLTVGLSACGDDDDDDPVVNDPGNIAEVASGNSDFSTLVTALQAAGLDSVVADENATYTVFAPNNAAFAKIPSDDLNALLADTDKLKEVLLYHVVAGSEINSDAAIAAAGTTLETANTNKDKIAVSLTGSDLFINLSKVIAPNVDANNGIIHGIDTVMFPPEMQTPTQNIVALAQGTPALSSLVAALLKVQDDKDLVAALSGPGPFTVFAPTNDAFSAFLGTTPLADVPNADLIKILEKHVVSGEVDSIAAFTSNGKDVPTLNGETIALSIEDDGAGNNVLYIDGMSGPKVVTFDVKATNGVVHVIDKVIALD